LVAYEVGYRAAPLKSLSIDIAAYYNNHRNFRTSEPSTPFLESVPPPTHLIVPITFENLMHGDSAGIEIAVNWQANHRWTLSPGYAYGELHMRLDPKSQDTTSVKGEEGSSPSNSAQLRSHLKLWHGLEWDASAYFVGRLADPLEPSYTRVDSGLSFHFQERAYLSLVGQNLLRDAHQEFVDTTGTARATLVKRSAYVKVSWQF
jgi:iron complex outermembrane receptor protein